MGTRLDFKRNLIPRPFWRHSVQPSLTVDGSLSPIEIGLVAMKLYMMLAPLLLHHVAVRISLID